MRSGSDYTGIDSKTHSFLTPWEGACQSLGSFHVDEEREGWRRLLKIFSRIGKKPLRNGLQGTKNIIGAGISQ